MLGEDLRAVLEDGFVEQPDDHNVTMKDKDSEMEVEVRNVPRDTVVVSLSNTNQISSLKAPANWICDYVVITQEGDNRCHAKLVELKNTLRDGNERKAFEQLRRSQPLVPYLLDVCRVESGTEWEATVTHCVIAKRESRLDKQPIRPHAGPQIESYREINVAVHICTTIDSTELVNGA